MDEEYRLYQIKLFNEIIKRDGHVSAKRYTNGNVRFGSVDRDDDDKICVFLGWSGCNFDSSDPDLSKTLTYDSVEKMVDDGWLVD